MIHPLRLDRGEGSRVNYANELRLEVADPVRALARAEGIEIRQVNYGERQEAVVEEILATRGRREGVVCLLGAMERCRCFKVGKNQTTGFLQLQWRPGKCQPFYVYFIPTRSSTTDKHG